MDDRRPWETAEDLALRQDLIERSRALRPLVEECWAEIESARRLPDRLVSAMAESGLFRTTMPRALGGFEADPLAFLETVEPVASVDGSAGWCLALGAETNNLVACRLPLETADEAYGKRPLAVTAGSARPAGRAEPVSGGYQVSGRWPFASGCQYATSLFGECVLYEGDSPRIRPNGFPETRAMLFVPEECTVIETWDAAGMRGTGSHDFAVEGLFVPEERSFAVWYEAPKHNGPLYRFPLGGLLSLNKVGVGSGIGRAAVDAFVDLAREKLPLGASTTLAQRATTQIQVAEAEVLLGSSRAFVFEVAGRMWMDLLEGRPAEWRDRALLRSACINAAQSSARAVDLMYHAAGMSGVLTGTRLERIFRDIHVFTQHLAIAPSGYEVAGRALLGLEPNGFL